MRTTPMTLRKGREQQAAPPRIADRFAGEHVELERVLKKLMASFRADDREGVALHWATFDRDLRTHLEAEEQYLIPALQAAAEGEARGLLQEHSHIRTRLLELGVGIDLHIVRLAAAREFVSELHAHAEREQRMLYTWADRHLSPQERQVLFGGLRPEPRLRGSSHRRQTSSR